MVEAQDNTGDVVETGVAAIEAQTQAEKSATVLKKLQSSKVSVKGELSGKASGIRTTWFAEVTDVMQACEYYKDEPQLKELLTKLGSAAARGGRRQIPGFKVDSKEKVG